MLKERFSGDHRIKFLGEPVCEFQAWNGHAPLNLVDTEPLAAQLHFQNAGYSHYKRRLDDLSTGTVVVTDRYV